MRVGCWGDMKRGELIILWVGGLLSVGCINPRGRTDFGVSGRDSILNEWGLPTRDAQPSMAAVLVTFSEVMARLLAIWIICGLVWLTLYRCLK
jgi:hypothetical protein